MIATVLAATATSLLGFWAAAAALQLALWAWARRVGNWAWVDVGWSASFAVGVAVWIAWRGDPPWPLAALILTWSLRLAFHLARDRVIGHPEEGRYVELRRRWGQGGDGARAFFVFYQAQALLAAVLAVAMVVPFVAAPLDARAGLRWVGLAIGVAGLITEAVADAQLAAWKRVPAHRGKVCDVGLWRWSRHPNYFGEWCVWIGYAVYATAYPWGAIAWIGPAIILASIWKVTGIPATEAQALRSRGDAYRRYQATTSAFVPWPPRRAPEAT